MELPAFLYRRLGHFVTCVLRFPEFGSIRLYDKYQVASFQDVFCHPFYWKALDALTWEPRLVVDCGTHCGHFTLLSSICIRSAFPSARPEIVLIEPNRKLIHSLNANIKFSGIEDRVEVVEGLVGRKSGQRQFFNKC